ncbi:MAG: TonB-dependent receptor [Alphaproteobacteria bacterium]|nr:TonB-dependent receptor [Alphaproteobacteria bacterium]MBU2197130.1 TonB-dependent receptor [Alphaproteobacteria bacterium]
MNLRYKKLLLTTALATASLCLSAPAYAQVTEVDADARLDTVTVIGQRAMMESAIARQRASDTIQSVVTRDALGQFPDQNVAESTRRLTGVNILDDQGEGRFISVRGLDPTLNASSINGVRLPSPESDTRAVALDVVASELVESIEVKKTLTPDMDADTIGASIEINTTKAFDRDDLFLSTKLEGSYNDLNGEYSPKAAVDFSIPISDTFGVAGGLSFSNRKTSTDNIEMGGWTTDDSGVTYAEDLEYRDYDVERERLGGSLSFDWKATDTTTLYARAIYSKFDDTEKRQRLVFAFSGSPVSGDADSATFVSGDGDTNDTDDRIRVRRGLKDRFESQIIQSYQVGGETETGPWKFDYKLAYSEAEEHEYDTQDPTRFQQDFKDNGELSVNVNYANLEKPVFSILTGADDFNDASGYEFTELAVNDGMSKDKEWSAKGDIARTFDLASGEFEFKTGLKVRLREKTYSANNLIYDEFDGADDYTLADVTGKQTYGLADLGVLPDLGKVRAFYAANKAGFVLNEDDSFLDSISGAYEVQEDIYAAYAQGKYSTDRMTLIGGVRVEQTKDDLGGNLVDEDAVTATPLNFSNDYTNVLPSLNLKYEAMENLILRAGVFASVVRPGIGQMAPRSSINEDLEASFGNPDLDPYKAWNGDLSIEYYPNPGTVLQAGVFYKDIKDFIVEQTFQDDVAPYNGVFNGIAFTEATIPINGDTATVQGIELNYQQALDFLPGLLDGMLVGLNYTYTDAQGDVPDGDGGMRSIMLPAAAKNTYNAMLGYEKGGLSLRLTAAYRDEYLDELGSDAGTDRYVKDHLQIDASAKYRFTDRVQGFVEFVNMGDEPYVAFQKGPDQDRLLQYETYSWTGKVGVRLTY